MEVMVVPLGVTVAGSKSHDAYCGRFVHCSVTGDENPPSGVVVIMKLAEWPVLMVAVAGITAMV